jgi:SH3-like domain-containing protein
MFKKHIMSLRTYHLALYGMAAVLLTIIFMNPTYADKKADLVPVNEGTSSGLPIPRFVAIKSHEANARTGPSERYPIKWVYVRKGTPVEVTAEFGHWRKIRDVDAEEGWVHESLLGGQRNGIIRGQTTALFHSPKDEALAVLKVEPGVIVSILSCEESWCKVEVDGTKGYLHRDTLWGVYKDEHIG